MLKKGRACQQALPVGYFANANVLSAICGPFVWQWHDFSCYAFQTMQQTKLGILTGQVVQGPISPVQTGNESSTLPAGGVQLRISRLNGNSVKTVVTDSQGRYEIALPEGRYRVTLSRLLSGTMVKDLQSELQIQSGHRARLDIRLDTGIR